MCTAIHLHTNDHYFGRTLDLDCSYGEEVCILPRRFSFPFRQVGSIEEHPAIIGMATVVDGLPLLYDAVNEHGLAMAGLNFPGNAYYPPVCAGKANIAPFELIPYLLFHCKTVAEAQALLSNIHLANIPFSEQLLPSPLHFILADKEGAIVLEPMQDGLHIYEDPVGVLTNNPPFPFHLRHLCHYRNLRADNGENTFAPSLALDPDCQGMGAIGLPGDLSSPSRFVRAAFGRAHAVCGKDELSSVSQFFHLLGTVEMTRGCCQTEGGHWDITIYSACMNLQRGLYYYTTYDNHQISCVDLHRADLDSTTLLRYPLILKQQMYQQN